jgi:lipopolysaccharide export system permease protein
MKILDRYILAKFLVTWVFTVLILIAIITVIDFTEKNDNFLKHGLEFKYVAKYYLQYIPYIANLITPITVFIATVFVTARLAGRTEIIAMLAGGVSFMRLLVPYMIGAVMIAALNFYLNAWVIPEANKERIAFEIAYAKKPFYYTDRDIHIKVAANSYVYMESYNNQRDVGYRFTIETIEDKLLKDKISARRIEWDTASVSWKLKDWERRSFDGFKEYVSKGAELDTTLSITPKDFGSTHGMHETLNLRELSDYIQELKSRGAENVDIYVIERYIRYMAPWAVIILTFIGVIVSARKSRGGTGAQIALGFVIAFIYILFFIMSRAVAENSAMNQLLAVWLPNIVFSVVGIILYKTVPR